MIKFKKSIDSGLLKIMSKMGISVISSYRGGCNFEAVGLSRAIVSDYFPGMSSRVSGIGVIGIEKKIKELHHKFSKRNIYTLPIGGLYRYRKSGENHQYDGNLIHLLQSAVGNGSYDQYKKYSSGFKTYRLLIYEIFYNLKIIENQLVLMMLNQLKIFSKDSAVEVCPMELCQLKHMKF